MLHFIVPPWDTTDRCSPALLAPPPAVYSQKDKQKCNHKSSRVQLAELLEKYFLWKKW